MSQVDGDELADLLEAVNAAQPGAWEKLSAQVYDRLRGMVRQRMRRRFGAGLPGVTLQPTEVAHEILLRLLRQRAKFDNSGHLLAIMAIQTNRVLIDYYRRRRKANLLDAELPTPDSMTNTEEIERVCSAVDQLRALDARKADVVLLRYYLDFTIEDTAAVLGVGHATVERDCEFARRWLAVRLDSPTGNSPADFEIP